MFLALLILAVLGLIFGSFINALVWRIHQQDKGQKAKAKNLSILNGRSMCPSCGHELAARDLIPVFSWLSLRGRCRYCHQPISAQYPVVELATALIFVGSYYFWPGGVSGVGEKLFFISWLATSVGLIALLVYDSRWMLLPNRLIYPTLAVAAAGRLAYLIDFEPRRWHGLLMWLTGVLVASGLFFLLFTVSQGRWIGYGDVRLGLITGTVLAQPAKSLLMIFLASILGTLFVLPSLARHSRRLTAKLPFGPFLIAATALTLLFGSPVLDWYQRTFLP